jgi:dTDP-4-dehydrorhamnose reductase
VAGLLSRLGDGSAPARVYHGTSAGAATWFDLARETFRLAGADPDRVRPTTAAAFPRPAARPADSVLGHDRWHTAGITPIRPWRLALAEAVPRLAVRL